MCRLTQDVCMVIPLLSWAVYCEFLKLTVLLYNSVHKINYKYVEKLKTFKNKVISKLRSEDLIPRHYWYDLAVF